MRFLNLYKLPAILIVLSFCNVGSAANKTFSIAGNFSNAASWGGSLPVAGDNLTINATCTIDNNTLTDNIDYGTLTIGSSTAHTLNWAVGGTNHLNVSNVSGGSVTSILDMTNGGTLIIRGTWTSTHLSFTSGTGTIEMQSTITLPSTYTTYHNLTINKSGITVSLAASISIKGDLTISSGTYNANNFNITVSGDWINNSSTTAFTAGTGTVTFNGTIIDSIGGSIGTTFNKLTIDCTTGGHLTLGVTTTVGGLLTFTKGNIITGPNSLYLNSTGSVTHTSGNVIGNFKKYIATGATSKTFEIGDSTNYTPVSVVFPNVTTAGDLTASVTATDHPNLPGSGIRTDGSVNRYYTLTNSSITFTTVGLTMNWVAGDIDAGSTFANFKVGKYSNSTWALPSVASPAATSIQATSLTSFGDFVVGELCSLTSSAATTLSCVGGSTGTITASGISGSVPYTFSLGTGTYQSIATFTGLAAGTYTINVTDNAGCTSTTSNVIVSEYPTSTDVQTTAGTDTWIGHIYNGTSFSNYIGQFTETETFDESFGGDNVCFPVTSNSLPRSINTESFSVKFRMNSTKRGLYTVDLGSDDGSRLTIDTSLAYNNWVDQSFTTKPKVLISLNGASSLLYEFYENGGSNRVVFQNLTLILANSLSSGISQSICLGNSGSVISGDSYGVLPTGVSLSGTGYQWSYSTTPTGTRTIIAGATAATFTPSTTIAPFNTAGTFYLYRNAKLSSINNISPNPYMVSQESNSAIITVTGAPSAMISYSGSPYCSNSGTASVTLTGTSGGMYSSTSGLSINGATGAITLGTSTPGSYIVTYSITATGGCGAYITTTSVTITGAPTVVSPVAYCLNSTAAPLTATGTSVVWSGNTSGSSGGSTALTSTAIYVATDVNNNRKTFFTTTTNNVNISTIDYYITSWQTVNNLQLGIFNSSGTLVCSSSTITSTTAVSTVTKITNVFNYMLATAGSYSIGIVSGSGNIGADNPSFPITEATGTINITGVSPGYRCFNNIQFTSTGGSSTAPTPSTSVAGTTYYSVTQTVNGCVSVSATIAVIVNTPPSATISYTGTPFCVSLGTAQPVTQTGTSGGTYTASPNGLTINVNTGAITPNLSTAGIYTVTYSMAPSGGCSLQTTTTAIAVSTLPSATISYAGNPYCLYSGTASVTQTGTNGGIYSSTAGLNINSSTGSVILGTSTTGTYTVTYSIAASGGCSVANTTTSITINPTPVILQLPATSLVAYYKFEGNANDFYGNNNGTLQNSPVPTADRFNINNSAYIMDGSTNYVSTTNSYSNPTDFTISIWFKTATTTGGKLIGFGSSQTGASGQYDRHIYMNNAGQLYFGVYNGSVVTLNSTLSYNDNNWHLVTATLSATSGMAFYIDGQLVGSNTSVTTAENHSGYWRIGYDNMNNWTSQPSSFYFNGILDDALIYSRALTASEISIAYLSLDGAANNSPVCAGTSISLTSTALAGASYTWTGPNSFTASTANPTFTYTGAAAGTYKLQATVSGCTATAYTNVISSGNTGQWIGKISTDWANINNWCSATLPGSGTNVGITASATNMPSVTTMAFCNNLTINAGATITSTIAGTLNIAGTIINNGTFDATNGTIGMNGTSAQTIPASVFTGNQIMNLTINNNAGVTLNGPLQLTGILLAANGQFNTGGNLTLLASASQTALIDGTGAGNVLGNVTMQGYLASGFGYHYISSPFQGATVSQLSNDINLAATFPSLYKYDESQLSAGWINYTDSTGLLIPLQGYTANFGSSTLPKIFDIKGVVNNGIISTPTLYNHNNPYTLGFNLIGNPYPSPIDLSIVSGWTATNIDNAVYFFDASTTDQYSGTYNSYINGVSSNGLANTIIPAMQGFFIHVTNGTYPVSANLTFNNKVRINQLAPSTRALNGIDDRPIIRLNIQSADDATVSDPVVVYFDDLATPAYDKELDALKLMNTDAKTANLYVIATDATNLSISAIPNPGDSIKKIPLGLEVNTSGWLLFNASTIKNIPAGMHLYLSDTQAGIIQDLQLNPSYRLYLPAGKYKNRFFLTFSKGFISTIPETDTVAANELKIYSTGTNLMVTSSYNKGTLILMNMLGQVVMKEDISGIGSHEIKLQVSSGIYLATLVSDKARQTKKIFIRNR